VRLHNPAAIKKHVLGDDVVLNASRMEVQHTNLGPRALASLIDRSPDLRRSLSTLAMTLCCRPSLLQILIPFTACSSLTELRFGCFMHARENKVPADVLQPLYALRLLQKITLNDKR
jgi:hypothetical protein